MTATRSDATPEITSGTTTGETSDTPSSSPQHPGAPASMTPGARGIIVTLLIAVFVVILNETIMGVALPRLMTELRIGPGTGQWLTTAFMLTMAVVIPTTGFLLQRLTTRQVFVTAMTLFSTGTLLAGLSTSFWLLLLARIVQASGTAMMLPLLMTTILTLVPMERRGLVMGNVSIAISVAPAIGPTLSGLILQYLSWRFMFLLVLPVAVAALGFGAARLVNVSGHGRQPLDVWSVLLSVPAFGGVVLGLSRLSEAGTGGGLVSAVVPLVVGVVALVVFVRRQGSLAQRDRALLDFRAFAYPMFRRSVALMCIAMTALFGIVILLPIYLQTVRGLESLPTGLLLLPGGLAMGLLSPVVGRLFDRYGPRALTVLGSSLLVATMAGFSTVDRHTAVWSLLVLHVVLSIGLACLFTPAFTTALNPLPPHLYSHGSAILTTLQQVAGAAGTALLVTVLTVRTTSLVGSGVNPMDAENSGIRAAFAVAAVIGLGAVALALSLHRTPATVPVGGVSEREEPEGADPTSVEPLDGLSR